MKHKYVYRPEDGIFEISRADGGHVATFEQCYPFDVGDRRCAYRASTEEFYAAIEHLFDVKFGGFHPLDKEQVNLRRSINTLSVVVDDTCICTTAPVANLLTFGAYPTIGVVAGTDLGTQRLVSISPSADEVEILNYLFDKHAAAASVMATDISLSLLAVQSSLLFLKEKDYVLQKCTGEYALTKAGFFLVCEMARLSTEPLGDAREGLAWDMAEERLVDVCGFEKDYFFLSNFFAAPVCYDAIRYLNSEAAYQSWRCSNREERSKFSGLFAADAKKMGHHGVETRSDWDEVKLRVMREVLHAKFDQNPNLAEKLALTYGRLCESNNWHDNVYGDCACPSCRDVPGQNVLGNMLMEERRYWRNELKLPAGRCGSQIHEYRLYQEPFQMILNGEKDIELRLWDSKRRQLRIGDKIRFFGPDAEQWIVAEVQSLAVFPDFGYLFSAVDPARCGSSGIDTKSLARRMRDYYSVEELEKHNVVAIGIRVIETHEANRTSITEGISSNE